MARCLGVTENIILEYNQFRQIVPVLLSWHDVELRILEFTLMGALALAGEEISRIFTMF